MKSILDKDFKYVPSSHTDIRKRFERVRRDLKIPTPKPATVVVPIEQGKKK
jgi:hypothetical protein